MRKFAMLSRLTEGAYARQKYRMRTDGHPFVGSTGADGAVALGVAGLTFGRETLLVRFEKSTRRLAIAADRERCLALLAIAKGAPVSSDSIRHLEVASAHWDRGDRALANFRLIFSGLPRLENPGDVARLRAAEYLLDHGMTPRELLEELRIDAAPLDLEKYDPNQPRVPAGQGAESGRWTRFLAWLEEPVPVYDQDTGDEVGTRSRGSAIATNPLTIIGVGAAALAAAEMLALEAAGVAVEELTPFAQRYLSMSGGRLGTAATRRQLYEIAEEYKASGKYVNLEGDGQAPDEYIPGSGPGTKGSNFVDFTARSADGTTVRVQTVDTLKDGVTPTKAELDAAARIREVYPNDDLILIPKRSK